MGPVWRWGLICGGCIILVDLVAALVSAGQPSESVRTSLAASVDLALNLALYSFCGFRVGLETRVARSAAEAGVTAGVLAGVAAILVGVAIPPPANSDTFPVVAVLAQNVAMGGILALGSGFLASRQPPAKR